MTITLTIETDNAAFARAPFREARRIIREAADRLTREAGDGFPLRDVNGNTVGRLTIKESV
jgi:hypothetical protein